MASSMEFGQSNLSSGFRGSGQCDVSIFVNLIFWVFRDAENLGLPWLGVGDDLYTELWRACAGPLVEVPRLGERVYYFPQGHMEQVGFFKFSILWFLGLVCFGV